MKGYAVYFRLASHKNYINSKLLYRKLGSLKCGKRGVVPSEGVNYYFISHVFLPFLCVSGLKFFGSVGCYKGIDDLIEVTV